MLKKKNIAMVMAATTVATSVAPVFAAVEKVTTVDAEKLLSEVERLLEVKYTDSKETGLDNIRVQLGNEYQNSVYKISVGGTDIKSVNELRKLIEDADVNGTSFVIDIVDKGHKEENGEIVAIEKNEFIKYSTADLNNLNTDITNAGLKSGIVKNVDPSKNEITLANNTKITLTTDDYKLDLTKPVDKDGELVDTRATGAMATKVVGFEKITTGKVKEYGIPGTKLAEVTYTNKLVKLENNISDFKTEDGYTESGKELVNLLVAANKDAVNHKTTTIRNGKKYNVTFNRGTSVAPAYTDADITGIESVEDGGYKLTVKLLVQEENAVVPTRVEMVINADSQKELKLLRDAMIGTANVTVGQGGKAYTSLNGEDRFETAIKISKAAYPAQSPTNSNPTVANEANAVILVGKDAVVDGLAAAPLAAQENAPILLADKDSVSKETLTEMKRVLTKTGEKLVYIIGGENTISTEVEKQLSEELGAKIVRLKGDDRYETSLAIAKKLTITGTGNEVFVVGGDGLADAMSIAPVASNNRGTGKVSPIIVTPESGLTTNANHFIDKNSGISKATVVGGETKVSKEVLNDLKEVLNKRAGAAVLRIAGDDRHETNVKVIDRYYTDNRVTKVFVAQDGYVGGDSKLIDALAVASYAGSQNAPIVLATSDLTQKQADIIDKKTQKHNGSTVINTLTKVGGGVASKVMNRVLDILGL